MTNETRVKLVLTYPWLSNSREPNLYRVQETINSTEWQPGDKLDKTEVKAIITRGTVTVITRQRKD